MQNYLFASSLKATIYVVPALSFIIQRIKILLYSSKQPETSSKVSGCYIIIDNSLNLTFV